MGRLGKALVTALAAPALYHGLWYVVERYTDLSFWEKVAITWPIYGVLLFALFRGVYGPLLRKPDR